MFLFRRLRLCALIMVLASLSSAVAACVNSQWVETVGYGAPGATAEGGTSTALAAALAEAVVQVNGTFLQQLVQIESAVTTRIGTDSLDSESVDYFREQIEQSTSGVIMSFEIIERAQEHGLVKLTVRAAVCADPRIILDLSGDLSAVAVIESELVSTVQGAGWQVAAAVPLHNISNPIETFFATGATHIFTMQVFVSGHENYRDLELVRLEVSATLSALGRSELTGTYVAAAEGLGVTRDAAVRTAAANAAPELGSALLTSLAGGPQTSLVSVIVTNVQRPSTRFEIENQIAAATGTELVGSIDWDDELKRLSFRVSSAKPTCDLAASIADSRRLLLNVETCSAGRIELRTVRE